MTSGITQWDGACEWQRQQLFPPFTHNDSLVKRGMRILMPQTCSVSNLGLTLAIRTINFGLEMFNRDKDLYYGQEILITTTRGSEHLLLLDFWHERWHKEEQEWELCEVLLSPLGHCSPATPLGITNNSIPWFSSKGFGLIAVGLHIIPGLQTSPQKNRIMWSSRFKPWGRTGP